jgi:hypothetical protein
MLFERRGSELALNDGEFMVSQILLCLPTYKNSKR